MEQSPAFISQGIEATVGIQFTSPNLHNRTGPPGVTPLTRPALEPNGGVMVGVFDVLG
jgi:hypothetical protein